MAPVDCGLTRSGKYFLRPKVLHAALMVLALTAGPLHAQITNHEAPGNLQSRSPLGCVALSALTNQNTPADIYPGVAACIKAGAYQKAVALIAVAGTFAYYDKHRVTDVSARQAAIALKMNALEGVRDDQMRILKKTLLAEMNQKSASFKSICSAVERLGPPKYFPSYMVQHGMSAFLGRSGNGINADFETAQAWQDSTRKYLRCP